MSVKIMSAVWELDLPRDEKIVLLAFADHADDYGRCFPSVARIAWKCGYSERSVQRKIGELVESGLLVVDEFANGGRGITPRYRVVPSAGRPLADFEKGDNLSKGDNAGGKGDKPSPIRLVKGDKAMSPESSGTTKPSGEPTEKRASALSLGERDVVVDMHALWTVMLGAGRTLDLTPTRRSKYAALYREQLSKSSDPLKAFKLVLRAVQLSEHHMSDRAYQMPESLFRGPDRRSTWIERTAAMIEKASSHTAAADAFVAEVRRRQNGGHV